MRSGAWESLRLLGSVAKAKTAYREFLTLWKDADPEIPICIAVKSDKGKLQIHVDGMGVYQGPLAGDNLLSRAMASRFMARG